MLKFKSLKPYLDEFSELVKQGKYKKIDYKTYQLLRRVQNIEGYVEFTGFTYSDFINKIYPTVQITFTSFFDWTPPIDLDRDNEFGRFLYDKTKEDLANQMYYTTTTNTNGLTINENYVTTTTTGNFVIDSNSITLNNKIEEKKDMNLIKGFDFGSCENDNIKVSFYGVAVKNATGTWVSYDKETNSIIDVDILNFDAKYLYKMPVAIKDVAIGDCIIHNKVPVYVTEVRDKSVVAIDPRAGEEKTILLTHSMFGFDFITKVINLFDNFMSTATADAPFGNLVPLMMMSEGNNDMLPLMMMASPSMNMDINNPILLYLMTKDGNTSNLIPYFYLMSQKK